MLAKYLVGINWADFLIIGIIARMCFIGTKTGIGIELFKLLNLWLVTVISFHVYTTLLSDWLNSRLPALPLDAGDVFVFVALATVITIVLRIIRESFFLLVKIEAEGTFNKLSGLIIGAVRGLWISSICLFVMTISTVGYLEVSAKSSLFGHKLINLAPQIYKGSFEGLFSKFMPGAAVNEEVSKVLER
jgi:uncharacterized membrane protein required for colicin V production